MTDLRHFRACWLTLRGFQTEAMTVTQLSRSRLLQFVDGTATPTPTQFAAMDFVARKAVEARRDAISTMSEAIRVASGKARSLQGSL